VGLRSIVGRWTIGISAVIAVIVLLARPAGRPTAAAATHNGLDLSVKPAVSAVDTPLTIRVAGLRPGQRVTLTASSVDARGVEWRESIEYAASRLGVVDPAAQSGTDRGGTVTPDAMAPVDLMTAPSMFSTSLNLSAWPFGSYSGYENAYWWVACGPATGTGGRCTWSAPRRFTFTASSGSAHASVTVEREPAMPVTATIETVAARGFYGVLWEPPANRDNHIGILEFGGSGGGVDTLFGALLASHGYPTLDLAYFDAPGLGREIGGFSLEYFAGALRWLRMQPGVDPRRVWVAGWSLGSEAALQLGVYYPHLVHGVLALEPNDVPACTWDPDTSLTIWNFRNLPLPCTNLSNPAPAQNPYAVIPVAKIHAPIFMDCGGADGIWNACIYAAHMMAQLRRAHDAYAHELLDYSAAGHGLGAPVPYDPGVASLEFYYGLGGQTVMSNPVALASQWGRLLAFLRH
jgi:dienelactone hydrolase